jgi:signal transduction histidine kinase
MGKQRIITPFFSDEYSVGPRQTIVAVLSGATLATLGAQPPGPANILLSGMIVLALTLIAAWVLPWRRWHVGYSTILPVLDVAVIMAAQVAVGSDYAYVNSTALLPVIWICSLRGYWNAVRGVGVLLLGIATTYALGLYGAPDAGSIVRLAARSVVFVFVGFFVNALVTYRASQESANRELAAELETQLALAEESRAKLQHAAADAKGAKDFTEQVLAAVTSQAIIGTTTAGIIDVWNTGAERIIGYQSSDVLGTSRISELAHDLHPVSTRGSAGETPEWKGWATPELFLQEQLDPANPLREWVYTPRAGGELVVRIAGERRTDESGEVVGFLFVVTDVSRSRELERLREKYVSMVSHELRTPLGAILGYIDLLREAEDPLTEQQTHYLDIVERNGERLLRLVGDLLFTEQVEARTIALRMETVDASGLVVASVQTAALRAEENGVTLILEIPDHEVLIGADPLRIGQAVDNLLSNAIKFTPPGGEVTVALTATVGEVTIRVTDTGIGIPEDEVQLLFTRFFRASNAKDGAIPGVGLGLTITRSIVAAHGGRLDVDSTVDVGTTFTMALPVGVVGDAEGDAPGSIRV